MGQSILLADQLLRVRLGAIDRAAIVNRHQFDFAAVHTARLIDGIEISLGAELEVPALIVAGIVEWRRLSEHDEVRIATRLNGLRTALEGCRPNEETGKNNYYACD